MSITDSDEDARLSRASCFQASGTTAEEDQRVPLVWSTATAVPLLCNVSVSVSVSESALCKHSASVLLATVKKPLSIKCLSAFSISFSGRWRRNESLPTLASITPSILSLASSQSIGASALLAVGKQ